MNTVDPTAASAGGNTGTLASRLWSVPLTRTRHAVIANRAEIAVVVALTAFAAALRVWHLGTVPLGLHGDEAWTGLDARRVLHEGWIAPYVKSALGQPTGPLYVTALLFRFFPDTTFTLRLSMALFGIATIPLAYFAFRTMFGRTVATIAALLLAGMMWHLHLSRTGFMVSAWPFMEMAALWALFVGIARRSTPILALAGVVAGAGIYTYNAYLLFLPVVAVPLVWAIISAGGRRERWRMAYGVVAFVAGALVIAIPMLLFISLHWHLYQQHEAVIGITHTTAWADAGVFGKAEMIRHRFDEWALGLATGNRPDLGDGLAGYGQPVVNPVVVALALAGLGCAIWRWRRAEYAVVLAAVLIMPIGALATEGDGLFRRTFGLAPFVALLAALPLAWVWERAAARSDRRGLVAALVVALAVAYPSVTVVRDYFGPVQDDAYTRYIYPFEEDDAAHYVASLPPGTIVYFYSDRWSFNYETMRFIAPNAEGIDRSVKFGGFGFLGAPLEFGADRTRPSAFVFLDTYLGDLSEVTDRYAGGTVTEGSKRGYRTFLAYFLPQSQ